MKVNLIFINYMYSRGIDLALLTFYNQHDLHTILSYSFPSLLRLAKSSVRGEAPTEG